MGKKTNKKANKKAVKQHLPGDKKMMQMSGIEMISKTFYINQDKKTVACKLECLVPMHTTAGFAYNIDFTPFEDYTDTIIECGMIPEKDEETGLGYWKINVVGKAKVDPTSNDEFDPEFGKKLSEADAKMRLFDKLSKYNEVVTDILFTMLQHANEKLYHTACCADQYENIKESYINEKYTD